MSSADVASSKSNTFGFLNKAQAIAILCFYPPESFTPLSPTTVSNPEGKFALSWIKSKAFAPQHASLISSSLNWYVSSP